MSKVCLGRGKVNVFKCLFNDELDIKESMGILMWFYS